MAFISRHPRRITIFNFGSLVATLVHLLLLGSVGSGCAESGTADDGANPRILVSLIAVGDTGAQHAIPALREGQISVARGMAAEDRRHPVDALVLLGDNFYPDGLRGFELVKRIRDNIVSPYCRFTDLRGIRSDEVADSCSLPMSERHPVPIFAVLGNHDYDVPESPYLQKYAIPEFVSNWHMPDGLTEVRELGFGVSLILFHSMEVRRGDRSESLREAIRSSLGPWRILAGHHPLAQDSTDPLSATRIAVPEAPVHLYLAGHDHNLQILEGRPPAPALEVIAGGGSTIHEIDSEAPNRRFALEQTGFARVELVRDDGGERLQVSLYAMPRYPIAFWAEPELVARWSVERDGSLRRQSPQN